MLVSEVVSVLIELVSVLMELVSVLIDDVSIVDSVLIVESVLLLSVFSDPQAEIINVVATLKIKRVFFII